MGAAIPAISGGSVYIRHPYALAVYGRQAPRLYHSGSTAVDTAYPVSPHDFLVRNPIHVGQPLVVTPADYVELRALAIAQEGLEGLIRRSPGFVPGSRPLRLWPFRWPTQPEIKSSDPIPDVHRQQPPGAYLDIVF